MYTWNMSKSFNPIFFSFFFTADYFYPTHAFNTPYLHFYPSSDSKTEPMSNSSINKQTPGFDHAHSLTSTQ